MQYRKKLIEVARLLEAINGTLCLEKMIYQFHHLCAQING